MTDIGAIAETGSLLGTGSEFEGKLAFLGTVRVEGRFRGEIRSDDTLVVADGGDVSGKLDVGSLIVAGGVVRAEVVARRVVELHPGGRLVGTVTTPSFQIVKGAVFEGTCRMPDDPNEEPPEPPADDPPPAG
jgi:cytoskeletal protein CcmA (bactofilin family)